MKLCRRTPAARESTIETAQTKRSHGGHTSPRSAQNGLMRSSYTCRASFVCCAWSCASSVHQLSCAQSASLSSQLPTGASGHSASHGPHPPSMEEATQSVSARPCTWSREEIRATIEPVGSIRSTADSGTITTARSSARSEQAIRPSPSPSLCLVVTCSSHRTPRVCAHARKLAACVSMARATGVVARQARGDAGDKSGEAEFAWPGRTYLAASRGTLFPALKHIYLHIPNKQHTRLKDTRGLNGAYTTIELLIDTQYGSLSRRAQTWPAPAHRRQ